ncbi:CLUMA_CG016056, isoform A [Clunio marinus]|uniref:CLUMA_CG016056, isoform A n=1 Tax=Clunio marinus TaxID=568069 RepID=A0A1J1IQS9_9DIPT|nr:CLUMA_CG016056, isoform A [Clunio marinus]
METFIDLYSIFCWDVKHSPKVTWYYQHSSGLIEKAVNVSLCSSQSISLIFPKRIIIMRRAREKGCEGVNDKNDFFPIEDIDTLNLNLEISFKVNFGIEIQY